MHLLKLEFSSFPFLCPGVGLLDHMVVLFLDFEGPARLFSMVAAPVSIPSNSVRGSLSRHPLQSFLPFNSGHSDSREAVPHGRFDLHVSNKG